MVLLLYIIYYTYTYTIIIYTIIILSYTILFYILFLFLFPFPLLIPPLPSSPSQCSFYTCRYLHILIYIILYSSILPSFQSSLLLLPLLILILISHPILIHSIRVGVYCWILISPRCLCSVLLCSHLFPSPDLFFLLPPHSKYTCRHLDILIYIPDSSNF